MNNVEVTSQPAKPTKGKKRKMSAAQKKALSDAGKARWAARDARLSIEAQRVVAPPPLPVAPVPPSPAILALQEQVVQRVSQRDEVRSKLTEAHTAYLLAQSRFQAAEAELKGIEQEVQYRISLIAQLENRPAQLSTTLVYDNTVPLMTVPGSLAGVTSEPAQPQRAKPQTYATGDAGDLRRELQRGMM